MKSNNFTAIGKIIVLVFASSYLLCLPIKAEIYTYGFRGCCDVIINNASDCIYVSFNTDSIVYEIDTSTMLETRSFSLNLPFSMAIDSNDEYLYVIEGYPGGLARIRLSDGQIDRISLEGQAMNLYLEPSEDRIWVVHRTWPGPGDFAGIEFVGEHLDTGLLTEIDVDSFSVNDTIEINELPMSVWYSPYSEKLYILHEDFWYSDPDWENAEIFANVITIYSSNSGTLSYEEWITAGLTDADLGSAIPNQPCNWTDDGRYILVPSAGAVSPDYSFRVIDTVDNSVYLDFSLPRDEQGKSLRIKYAKKIPGEDYIWAVIQHGQPQGLSGSDLWVARINTITLSYDIFPIYEGHTVFGNFDFGPDCDTLYLTQPYTDEIIKWTAPNLPPVCALYVITPMPYQGPSPAAIEFDASHSADPNECDTLTFEWDFDGDRIFDEPGDDDYTGDPDNPTHEYTSDYDGPAHLRVTDNHGAFSICFVHIIVDIV